MYICDVWRVAAVAYVHICECTICISKALFAFGIYPMALVKLNYALIAHVFTFPNFHVSKFPKFACI